MLRLLFFLWKGNGKVKKTYIIEELTDEELIAEFDKETLENLSNNKGEQEDE